MKKSVFAALNTKIFMIYNNHGLRRHATIIPDTFKRVEDFCNKVFSKNAPCIFLEWTQKQKLVKSSSLLSLQNFDRLVIYDCINNSTLFIPSMDRLLGQKLSVGSKIKDVSPEEQEQMASLYRLLKHGSIVKCVWCNEADDHEKLSLLNFAVKPYLNISLLLRIAVGNDDDGRVDLGERDFVDSFYRKIIRFFDLIRNEQPELWSLSDQDQKSFDGFYL